MFTLKQIQEISSKLQAMSKKDSQFKRAESLDGSEDIPILQDNQNKLLGMVGFIDLLKDKIITPILEGLDALKDKIISLFDNQKDSIDSLKNEVDNLGTNIDRISRDIGVIENSINDLKILVDSKYDPIVSLSIMASPEDSQIFLNGQETSSIEVESGSNVVIKIIAEGYATYNEIICVHKDIELQIVLDKAIVVTPVEPPKENWYTVTVIPEPLDAVVYINGEQTCSLKVKDGTEVTITATADGYYDLEPERYIISADTEIPIHLQEIVKETVQGTLQVDTSQHMYTMEVSFDGTVDTQVKTVASVIFEDGEEESIEYYTNPLSRSTVIQPGVAERSLHGKIVDVKNVECIAIGASDREYAISQDFVRNLNEIHVTCTPEDAVIEDIEGCISLPQDGNERYFAKIDDSVTVRVTKDGYLDYQYNVDGDIDEVFTVHADLQLIEVKVILTVIPTPEDSIVTIDGVQRSSIEVLKNTKVHIEVSHPSGQYVTHIEDYTVAYTDTIYIVLDEVVPVEYELNIYQKDDSPVSYDSIPPEGGTVTLGVKKMTHYNNGTSDYMDVTDEVDFTYPEGISNDGTKGKCIVSQNTSMSIRSFIIEASMSGLTSSIALTQLGTDEDYIDLIPDNMEFEYTGGIQSLNISSNTSWTIN